ncbi:MAG TPA: glutathione S-transferase [Burkholderiales bacterium]|nr:glutathione S-transferase [Burkholderiales bacterium]
MIKLCGFHISNYHNKVRLALLEKGIAFDEDPECRPSQKDEFVARSAMGKVPFLELDNGEVLIESQAICEYLEDAFPQKPLLPRDPLARARVRELLIVIEMHMELVARRLYPQAFFGRTVSDEVKQSVEKDLAKGLRTFRRLVKFAPYVAGAELTLADCAAFVHLPLVSLTTKIIYGRDALEEIAQVKPYLKTLGERPAFERVNHDRKAAQAALARK